MKAFFTDGEAIPLPPGHTFPSAKYPLLRARMAAIADAHGIELVPSPRIRQEDLVTAHTREYVARVLAGSLTEQENRRIGFPWSPELVERVLYTTGGTLAAALAAREDGVAVNLAGGTHHAHEDFGAGYCVFNDIAIAALCLLRDGLASRVLVVDTDVHQGDGTARILWDEADIFTFSIHGSTNYPLHKASSDMDIGLPEGTGDTPYLEALVFGLERSFTLANPDVVIWVAGVDASVDDRLGKLSLSADGLRARDELVLGHCRERRTPVVVLMGGGYARDPDTIASLYQQTVLAAATNARGWHESTAP
jgi:acetoin utilization deacetylase AcuC-like enzyme